jgi:myo-inositol-1(or 4)-monophosphatase
MRKSESIVDGTKDAGSSAKKREIATIERAAVDLAVLAGAEIVSALGRILHVRYKSGADSDATWSDPVSEVDNRIEQLIRARLSERFPSHIVLGEEFDIATAQRSEFVWAIDPIDGTANFVNGFPMFAASIGVLQNGHPLVGAVWCSVSHALRAGVYHGHRGGDLRFDGDTVVPSHSPSVRRRLVGLPEFAATQEGIWDMRKTGSAALECAFVAAGLLEAAMFRSPNLWDVAAGLALVRASDGHVLTLKGSSWVPFKRFEMPRSRGVSNLRNWRQPIAIGRLDEADLARGMGLLPHQQA